MNEQRINDRSLVRHLLMAACFEGHAGRFDGVISNLSAGGCFVLSTGRVISGEALEGKVLIPTGRWVKIKGEVIYTIKGKGFGLCFVGLSDSERALVDLVMDYAKQDEQDDYHFTQ